MTHTSRFKHRQNVRSRVLALSVCGCLFISGVVAALLLTHNQIVPDASSDHALPILQSQSSQRTNKLQLYTVSQANDRQAVCNDGSPAKYYFRPGSEKNRDKWVIFFKGGGGCSSEAECLTRAREDATLVSSLKYPSVSKEDGIFTVNPELNPDFYDWNMVKIMYCSSDNFIGNGEQKLGGKTWFFHGKAITTAVIEDLQDPTIMKTANLSEASQVLVAGSSAGGGGAVQNIDDIADWLPQARVRGLIDSSWGMDIEPYSTKGTAGLDEDRIDAADFSNKQLDRSCLAANSNNERSCTILSKLYPYIQTPIFIFMNQYDHKKLENLGVVAPMSTSERSWLENTFIPALMASYDQIEDGLFSAKQSFHTMLTSPEYFKTTIHGTTAQQAFTNWYFDRSGPTRLIEE